MRVSVLVLSVDEAPMLDRCLPAVLAQRPEPEVTVIDNACTDATADVASRHGVRRLVLSERCSYAAAINQGLAVTGADATATDAVLLLNADCFLRPGFLAAALPRLSAPGIGSVAPRLLRVERVAGGEPGADAQIDAAGMVIDRRRKNGLVGHGRPLAEYTSPAPAFGADGAAALYRREVLDACRLGEREVLDEDMALWASDADLAWRAQLLGWGCVYEPAAEAEHVRTYSPSTRASVAAAHRRLQFRNRLLMVAKNETRAGLVRDGPRILGYEVLALGHAVLRERCLLGGYRDAWRLRAGVRRRRRIIHARRRAFAPGARVPFDLRPPA